MGLPSTHIGIFLAIPREFFKNLSDPQKEKLIILFDKYRDIIKKMILSLDVLPMLSIKLTLKAMPLLRQGLSRDIVLVMKKLLLKFKNC